MIATSSEAVGRRPRFQFEATSQVPPVVLECQQMVTVPGQDVACAFGIKTDGVRRMLRTIMAVNGSHRPRFKRGTSKSTRTKSQHNYPYF